MRKTGLPRRAVVLALFGLVVASATATTATLAHRSAAPAAPASNTSHDVPANLPLAFEAAEGGFASQGPGWSFALTPAEAVVGVTGGSFRLRPAGPLANTSAELVAGETLGGTVNRVIGDDPARWRTGAPTFGRVTARQVWPGVDVVWHGDQRRLQHDMVVAPGVDPGVVAFDLDGARSLEIDGGGDLVLDLHGTTARLARPVLYQDVGAERRPVEGAFALLGPSRIGFTVGSYDQALPLVIDPTLQTSSLLGGGSNDAGYAVTVDLQGNTYVTGSTESADFPLSAPLQTNFQTNPAGPTSDVFISKISPDGGRLIWSTFLGGTGRDTGFAVVVAGDGTVYVSGVTESADFPSARAAQSAYGGGASDGFVARIAASGSSVDWSTFVGGSQADRIRGLAVDSTGNAYVTGSTNSENFPSVNPQQTGPFRPEDLDAFLVKVAPAGAPFVFATRLGGGNDDRGLSVAVDSQGSAYVTGDTLSPGFPTVRPLQASQGGSAGGVSGAFPDAFVAKYNPAGSALVYSTFLGGGDFDQGTAITVDGQGAAYVAGNTNSTNFPTTGALQASKGGEPDAFVTKIDPGGSAVIYSTYLGGGGADGANAIAVDRTGSAHVVGTTGSANFVPAKATQAQKSGGDDAFLVKLDSTGRGPLFSSFVGGREADAGMGVAVDAQGRVRVLGLTASADFPSVRPVQGAKPPAGGDAFIATVDVTDPVTPTTVAPERAAAPAAASSDDAHDRRVRLLSFVTLALLLTAVAQTLYLRKRTPAVATRPATRPAPKPAPKPSASAGVSVLDKGAAAGGSKSTRSPKARGGPKGAAAQKKAAAARKAANRKGRPTRSKPAKVDAPTEVAAAVAAGEVAGPEEPDDSGPPTMAAPLTDVEPAPAPEPERPKPHAPAIASLLAEDLWGPEPSEEPEGEVELTPAAADAAPEPSESPPAPEWAPFDTGSTPAVDAGAPPPPPAAPIPPVPAEELSFWDLFPEDLPPARPAPFQPEDLLADHLALPEGPDSAAERLAEPGPESAPEPAPAPEPGPAPEPAPQPVADQPQPEEEEEEAPPLPERPPHPPEAEIVIAELLDGPPPTGVRASAESPWAPRATEDDFFIDDLLIDKGPPGPGTEPTSAGPSADDDGDDLAAATPGRGQDEQSRVAADQARRRRSRRGGRRKPPGPG